MVTRLPRTAGGLTRRGGRAVSVLRPFAFALVSIVTSIRGGYASLPNPETRIASWKLEISRTWRCSTVSDVSRDNCVGAVHHSRAIASNAGHRPGATEHITVSSYSGRSMTISSCGGFASADVFAARLRGLMWRLGSGYDGIDPNITMHPRVFAAGLPSPSPNR